ncbi:MAG TPA: hypothetical protein PK671_14850, partial [Candidatus Obscuribacter sp.]|nr:hypothetical protein [Candidatus Obscuribacter sp.]
MEAIRFGTDGWRAIIAEDFTFTNVERVAFAIGLYIKETYVNVSGGETLPVLLGYDTRFLADQFALRAARVLMAMGLTVRLASRDIPTPCIAWATQHEPTGGALQFTASHNPPEYCGVKYIPPYAGPATNDITAKITENLKHIPASGPELAPFGYADSHGSLSHLQPPTFDASEPNMVA